MSSVAPENGRVFFETDEYGLARANIGSRFAERILLELGSFRARSFEELFEGCARSAFEDWLPRDAAFPVKAGRWSPAALCAGLPADNKKAAAVRLGSAYGLERLPETGALCQIQFSIMKDRRACLPRHLRHEPAQAWLPSGAGGGAPAGDSGRRDGGHLRLPRARRLLRPLLRQRDDSDRGRARGEGPRAGDKPELCGGEVAGPARRDIWRRSARGCAGAGVLRRIPDFRLGHRPACRGARPRERGARGSCESIVRVFRGGRAGSFQAQRSGASS